MNQQANKQQEPIVQLSLPLSMVNLTLNALLELPAKTSMILIQTIQNQTAMQLQSKQPPPNTKSSKKVQAADTKKSIETAVEEDAVEEDVVEEDAVLEVAVEEDAVLEVAVEEEVIEEDNPEIE